MLMAAKGKDSSDSLIRTSLEELAKELGSAGLRPAVGWAVPPTPSGRRDAGATKRRRYNLIHPAMVYNMRMSQSARSVSR